MPQTLKIDPKIFNPLYWHLVEAFKDQNIFIILITGGSGAAKTYSLAQYFCFETFGNLNNTIIFRKESTSIIDSVFADFKTIGSKINNATNIPYFQFFVNKITAGKSKFRFRGLDDSEKIKGLADYKYVFMNEVSSFEMSEYSEIKRRLRGKPGQKIIADWNPIDENHWLKTELIDKEEWVDMPLVVDCPKGAISQLDPKYSTKQISKDGKILFIKTTYRDNFWCIGYPNGSPYGFKDENSLYNFEHMRLHDPMGYHIYANGNWGRVTTGGEFYKQFKTDRNCKVIPYDKDLSVHLSFDFNINPGMHATVWQIEGKKMWQISEIITKEPNNTTKGICDEFNRLFKSHKAGLYIYGDPSGRSRSTRQETGRNDYTLILDYLKQFHPTLRVAFAHPSVKTRGDFINSIFESNIQEIEIWINPTCTNTINDLMYTKEQSDGQKFTKFKERIKDPKTKISYEKYGHLSDSMDYFVCEAFKREYERYQGLNSLQAGMFKQVLRRPKWTL